MLAFMFLMMFIIGLLSGVILTVFLAATMDERDDKKMRKLAAAERREATKSGPILI